MVCPVSLRVAAAMSGVLLLAGSAIADLFVATFAHPATIRRFSDTGTSLGTFTTTGLFGPRGIAFDAGGRLYVGNDDGRITRYSPTGEYLGVFATAPEGVATSIVFDTAGRLYAATGTEGGTVRRFSPTGEDLGVFASSAGGPFGLAFNGTGELLVSTLSDDRVLRFAPDGAPMGVFASTGMTRPCGIALDPGGNLYVANFRGSRTIRRFSPSGQDLGDFTSGLFDPINVAFDSVGRLYVSEYSAEGVTYFAPDGTPLGVFAAGSLSGPTGLAFWPVPAPHTTVVLLMGLCAAARRRR